MATVSLTLEADATKALKILEAFEYHYGPKQPAETNKEFMERHIKELIKRFMRSQLAAKMAEQEFEDPFEIP